MTIPLRVLTAPTAVVSHPMIDGCAVSLGDVVTGPQSGPFSNGRVKGWSPCGGYLYVGWLGVVPIEKAQWCCDLEESKFSRLYRPVAENRWESEAVSWGMVA